MEKNGADHDIAMEGPNDLFIGNCDSTGKSEANDQLSQVSSGCLVFVNAFFMSSLMNLQHGISSVWFSLHL